ncbi:hypothetical protein CHH28_12945 [Bacterioplanes sanyensis]|uniref:Uncharacterized protein n=1 Tax=Bacterioplanes sanyensis TaxID=1249553 RepID=A0A222FKG6_9GAMM|nr:hypothetical protein [Bacterioplanes sanyensis]ASP39525.1 hypothetical protein CHH28_12945 [Bacterioplanes sanyensis]
MKKIIFATVITFYSLVALSDSCGSGVLKLVHSGVMHGTYPKDRYVFSGANMYYANHGRGEVYVPIYKRKFDSLTGRFSSDSKVLDSFNYYGFSDPVYSAESNVIQARSNRFVFERNNTIREQNTGLSSTHGFRSGSMASNSDSSLIISRPGSGAALKVFDVDINTYEVLSSTTIDLDSVGIPGISVFFDRYDIPYALDFDAERGLVLYRLLNDASLEVVADNLQLGFSRSSNEVYFNADASVLTVFNRSSNKIRVLGLSDEASIDFSYVASMDASRVEAIKHSRSRDGVSVVASNSKELGFVDLLLYQVDINSGSVSLLSQIESAFSTSSDKQFIAVDAVDDAYVILDGPRYYSYRVIYSD